jgi:hypothetical protein
LVLTVVDCQFMCGKCFISLKVNTMTCVIWGQKPNRLLTKERSRTSETRYHRRTNN